MPEIMKSEWSCDLCLSFCPTESLPQISPMPVSFRIDKYVGLPVTLNLQNFLFNRFGQWINQYFIFGCGQFDDGVRQINLVPSQFEDAEV